MSERNELIQSFIRDNGWQDAMQEPLASDCSNRSYIRLTQGPGNASAMVMDAPPSKGEDTRPFVKIAHHLLAQGLSAPRIFAKDEANGFLLIEDLGHDLYLPLVEQKPALEDPLYIAATDVLIALHKAPVPVNVPSYGAATMIKTAQLGLDWYLAGASEAPTQTQKDDLAGALADAFAALDPWEDVLVLRDYHAENLLWLPDRSGPAKVGLLDFQDAATGHPAYDLMSLGRDVRRDVTPDVTTHMLEHYAQRTGLDLAALTRAAATVSAQRNLRVLGVFARMSMHFARPAYVELLPRTWANLMIDLAHPDLAPLKDTVTEIFPAPTKPTLEKLIAKCGTIPTL
ncbi:MAG: aminoglycoside phosphotransferase family protein [Maritimibacter sp.]